MNYEQDLAIDPDSLDTEWLEQPRLMLRYAKHASKMKMEVERAKERLDIIKADLDKKIRVVLQEFGIVKLTESVITSTIITQVKFKEGNEEYLEAAYEANMAQGGTPGIGREKDSIGKPGKVTWSTILCRSKYSTGLIKGMGEA